MKQDNLYELRFSNLKVGVHGFEWKVGTDFLVDRGVEAFRDVDLDVALVLEKKERLMDLSFHIKGQLTTDCDRCGEDVVVEHDRRDHLVIRFAHETDLTDDEVVFLDENEQTFDASQFIYEFIMVGLPSRCVHPEGKCDPSVESYLEEASEQENEDKKDKAIDPRWEALKKLKNKS